MSEQSDQHPEQSLNISNSVLKDVQIGGIAGRDLKLFQILGKVWLFNIFGTVQVPQAPLEDEKQLSRDEHRWRNALLSIVKQFWIDGVLANSLHTKFLIELGLEDRGDKLFNPTQDFEEFSTYTQQVFPDGTSATDIFEDIGAGRTLLILGEPGAGKTVTLLKLAESLISRTEKDLRQPLPVVVNLSSWARQRKSIEKWLAKELYYIYKVSKSLGTSWIDNEQLILLLDGLDEVEAKHRNACVQALNKFIQDHGRTEMVVCCRIHDYEVLSEKLSLRSAIYVQPLSPQQINEYLDQVGEPLAALQAVIKDNNEILEFASSPLILSIMSLAYQDYSLDALQNIATFDFFLRHLFDSYIDRMFTRRGKNQEYSQEQTKYWLIWIAQRMAQTSQTDFLIERIQPIFLQTKFQVLRYRLNSALMIGLFFGLISGLTGGLFFGLMMGLFFGLFFGLNDGLSDGLSGGLIGGLIGGFRGPKVLPKMKSQGIWRSVYNTLIIGLFFGLISGLTGGLFFGLFFGLTGGLFFGLTYGLFIGLLTALIGGGAACIQHFTLRLMLYRMGHIPWNYARFLDYAADRLFLQKVGGGYIFVHRMLLEHFASMELEPLSRKA